MPETHPPPIPKTTVSNAGTVYTAMFMSGTIGRNAVGKTIRMNTDPWGNGAAASIRGSQSRSEHRVRHRPRPFEEGPALISENARGKVFSYRSAPRPIFQAMAR